MKQYNVGDLKKKYTGWDKKKIRHFQRKDG